MKGQVIMINNNYPNYRVSVEIVLKKDNKFLLVKRASDAKVAPSIWTVPAGKVKYSEIPMDAVIREAKEEISLDVKVIKEINCRTAKIKSGDEDAYRLLYTYLVEQIDKKQEIIIDEEHSEFKWVNKDELFKYKSENKDSLFSCIDVLINYNF